MKKCLLCKKRRVRLLVTFATFLVPKNPREILKSMLTSFSKYLREDFPLLGMRLWIVFHLVLTWITILRVSVGCRGRPVLSSIVAFPPSTSVAKCMKSVLQGICTARSQRTDLLHRLVCKYMQSTGEMLSSLSNLGYRWHRFVSFSFRYLLV